MNKVKATIHFEDHGQDFLEWDIDENNEVIACRPFQFSVWASSKVINYNELVVGRKYVRIMQLYQTYPLEIQYPVEKIVLQNGGG